MLDGRHGGRPSQRRAIATVRAPKRQQTHHGKTEGGKGGIWKTEGLPTPGVLASCVPAADLAAAAAAAALVAFAFATSRKFVPALLATLRILPLDPAALPFFSFAGVSALESSWPPRAAFAGGMGRETRGSKKAGISVQGGRDTVDLGI